LNQCIVQFDELTKRQNDPQYTQEQLEATRKNIQRHLDSIPNNVRKERKDIALKQQSGNSKRADSATKCEEQINQSLVVIDEKLTQAGITDEWYEAFRRDG